MKAKSFPKDTTAYGLNLQSVDQYSKIVRLIERLNCTTLTTQSHPVGSVMGYDFLCECDSNCLCTHRLQFIINFIERNYKEK